MVLLGKSFPLSHWFLCGSSKSLEALCNATYTRCTVLAVDDLTLDFREKQSMATKRYFTPLSSFLYFLTCARSICDCSPKFATTTRYVSLEISRLFCGQYKHPDSPVISMHCLLLRLCVERSKQSVSPKLLRFFGSRYFFIGLSTIAAI